MIFSMNFFNHASAQITINNSDMPSVNDIFIFDNVTPSSATDPVPTGPNFSWDFSTITYTSQQRDTLISVFSIPNIYFLAFLGSSYAEHTAPDFALGTFITFSDIYDIYKNSSSKYEYSGRGAAINSIPTPMFYSPRDVVYKFPLNFNNTDSSTSGFSITIPTLGDYSKARKRVNTVDGWGMLSLPTGNFQTLRVKSVISDIDSIVLTGLPFPIGFPSTTTEYKWLGKQQGVPLLQINTNQFGIVTMVKYLDNPVVGIDENGKAVSATSVFPNPASDNLNFVLNGVNTNIKASVFNSTGGKVFEKEFSSYDRKSIDIRNFEAGIYMLQLNSENKTGYKKFSIIR